MKLTLLTSDIRKPDVVFKYVKKIECSSAVVTFTAAGMKHTLQAEGFGVPGATEGWRLMPEDVLYNGWVVG
jgi:hypothetical protein